MSRKPVGLYSEVDAREIHKRVLGHSLPLKDLGNAQQLTIHNLLYYVLLEQDLDAASNELTGFTSAQGRIIRYVQPPDPSTLNMEETTSEASLITVTNRFTTFSASIGDLLLIIRNGSEWSPLLPSGNRVQCKLREDLLAAVDSWTDPSTAKAHVYAKHGGTHDMKWNGVTITVTNRLENISVDAGTYCKAEWIDGEWQLYVADCPGGSASGSF